MLLKELLDAKEAKRVSELNELKCYTDRVVGGIQVAISQGKTSIYFLSLYFNTFPKIMEELTAKGYKVTKEPLSDWCVSWKNS
jgi:hypothetical protein